MTSLTIDQLDLPTNKSITLAYSQKAGKWWAVLWRDKADTPLIAREADTPLAALGELFIAMNSFRVDRPI